MTRSRFGILAFTAIVLSALNLRTAVASLSPLIDAIGAEIPLSASILSVLGMLPPLCFAIGALATPLITHRIGIDKAMLFSLTALALALALRGGAVHSPMLIAASALTFTALGVMNVLMPALVKAHFPHRIGLVTTVYVTLMSVGTFLPPLISHPIEQRWGWRVSLGQWALLALIGALVWLTLTARQPRTTGHAALPLPRRPATVRWSNPILWGVIALCAGPGFIAYALFLWLPPMLHDLIGASATTSGTLLALYAAMGTPAGLVVPVIAARTQRSGLLIVAGGLFFVAGFAGFLTVPASAPWLWASLTGMGQMLFPLSLTLIALRTRTVEGAVWLGSASQSIAYTIAATGPLLMGAVMVLTGSWAPSLIAMIVVAVLTVGIGLLAAPRRFLEDSPTLRGER
ncbi:CynX/NimT family MFS transporter [Microbacterium sp. YY-01]|uniref:MFS transporter n=1 Tax=Microbacterium sp. YY-01 TaxID=3421634 RepID=UPI003D17CF79